MSQEDEDLYADFNAKPAELDYTVRGKQYWGLARGLDRVVCVGGVRSLVRNTKGGPVGMQCDSYA